MNTAATATATAQPIPQPTPAEAALVPAPRPAASVMTPLDMLNRAVETGAQIDVLERLMALYERWNAQKKREAFAAAISAAKGEIPAIIKDREVNFKNNGGKGRTNYRFENFASIARVIDPILAKHGLSYRFRTKNGINEPVTVTCILEHRDGHSEENSLVAGRDDTGNKNAIQAVGSTITYLQRYTLKPALGISAAEDDDGEAAHGIERVSVEQAAAIRELLNDAGASEPDFLAFMAVERVEDIPAAEYEDATTAIASTKAARAARLQQQPAAQQQSARKGSPR